VETLKLAGIDTYYFKGHSTRAASTTKACQLGVTVVEIIKTGQWTTDSTFKKFYHKDLQSVENFQSSLIGSVNKL